jgi:hypothetical protein
MEEILLGVLAVAAVLLWLLVKKIWEVMSELVANLWNDLTGENARREKRQEEARKEEEERQQRQEEERKEEDERQRRQRERQWKRQREHQQKHQQAEERQQNSDASGSHSNRKAVCGKCDKAFELIGLSLEASPGDVRQKRRAWAEVLHPDQLGSKSAGARKAAEEQLKIINSACDHILQCRV